jgi:hypothetical protein
MNHTVPVSMSHGIGDIPQDAHSARCLRLLVEDVDTPKAIGQLAKPIMG